jgi:hypothetical protein
MDRHTSAPIISHAANEEAVWGCKTLHADEYSMQDSAVSLALY